MTASPSSPSALDSVTPTLSGIVRKPAAGRAAPLPLIVALHGGTYTAKYFDVPGASLVERAVANGLPIVALDRPGYRASPALAPAQATVQGQARHLLAALAEVWERHGAGTRGIFLIGHSIGGAIAANIAALAATAASPRFPLLGLALSGMCLRTPPEHKPLWESLPDTPTVDMPPPVKAQMMFGPAGSYDPAIATASEAANAPAPKAELVDIVSTWTERAHAVLGAIAVPVHYRQSALDPLWIMGQAEVDGFAAALKNSSRVDAAMLQGTGHCIDLHHVGPALQLQQLGFALQCASERAE